MSKGTSVHCLNHILQAEGIAERIRWVLYTLTMTVGLILCLGQAMVQYFNHVTIFRETFADTSSGRYPDITLCENNKYMVPDFIGRVDPSFRDTLNASYYAPWIQSAVYRSFLAGMSPNISVISNELEAEGEQVVTWNSDIAKSPYHRRFHRFSVDVYSQEPYQSVVVLENVPSYDYFLCLTFQVVTSKLQEFDHISLVVTIPPEQTVDFTLFFHAENTQLNEFYPEHAIPHGPFHYTTVYYRSTVQTKLQRPTQVACEASSATADVYGHEYRYTQATCVDRKSMREFAATCGCSSQMHVLQHAHNPCRGQTALTCDLKTRRNRTLLSSCLPPCNSTKLVIDREVTVIKEIASMESRGILEVYMAEPVKREEEVELYTVDHLLNEMAGLCSLFMGLSSIIVFEVVAAVFSRRRAVHVVKEGGTANGTVAATR